MSVTLKKETLTFLYNKKQHYRHASQQLALQLLCGIDLDKMLNTDNQSKDILITRMTRLIERERLKGLKKHWSYDLNRHIALKQVLDILQTNNKLP